MKYADSEPFRILLVSDTHGQLSVINRLVRETKADAVIHAGDFGFYDNDSYNLLSKRELQLQITHSQLPEDERRRILELSPEEQVEAARQHKLLGDFCDYLIGDCSFEVPVYAVWGNHEDKRVVERLRAKQTNLYNLHLLDESVSYRIGPALVYGLGGNFLPSAKLLQPALAGGAGKIWSTLAQYVRLVRTVEAEAGFNGPRICVSHVSPGKEPFVEFIAARTRADLTVSGHMGAVTCMVWTPFAIRTFEEAATRIKEGLEIVKAECLKAGGEGRDVFQKELSSLIEQFPGKGFTTSHGSAVPRWYRHMTHINLPDADKGYGILNIVGGKWSISSHCQLASQ